MIEIEKKYKLSKQAFETIQKVLERDAVATYKEENVLYKGGTISPNEVLRCRKIKDWHGAVEHILTYKGKAQVLEDGIKSREEIEFETIGNPEKFLHALGYTPSLYYAKKRTDHKLEGAVVSLDELPFGYYMEIEGNADVISKIEHRLKDRFGVVLDVEMYNYPDLTNIYGKSVDGIMEARF